MPQSARICAIGGVKLKFGQCPNIHVFFGWGFPKNVSPKPKEVFGNHHRICNSPSAEVGLMPCQELFTQPYATKATFLIYTQPTTVAVNHYNITNATQGNSQNEPNSLNNSTQRLSYDRAYPHPQTSFLWSGSKH